MESIKRLVARGKFNISFLSLPKEVNSSISLLMLDNSTSNRLDTTSSSSWVDLTTATIRLLPIEISNQRIFFSIIITHLKLLTSVSPHQLRDVMDKVIYSLSWELLITWLQRSILKLLIKESKLTYSLLQLFYSLWSLSTHHSPLPPNLIHSINALLEIDQTFSGGPTARTSQVVRTSSPQSWRSSLLACFRWSHLTDHQCPRSWLIHGWRDQFHPLIRFKLNLSKKTN